MQELESLWPNICFISNKPYNDKTWAAYFYKPSNINLLDPDLSDDYFYRRKVLFKILHKQKGTRWAGVAFSRYE